jgi:hypothetical protein
VMRFLRRVARNSPLTPADDGVFFLGTQIEDERCPPSFQSAITIDTRSYKRHASKDYQFGEPVQLMSGVVQNAAKRELLASHLARVGVLSSDQAIALQTQLASQVAELHAANSWHGTIGVDTVLIAASGTVELLDRVEGAAFQPSANEELCPPLLRGISDLQIPVYLTEARRVLNSANSALYRAEC